MRHLFIITAPGSVSVRRTGWKRWVSHRPAADQTARRSYAICPNVSKSTAIRLASDMMIEYLLQKVTAAARHHHRRSARPIPVSPCGRLLYRSATCAGLHWQPENGTPSRGSLSGGYGDGDYLCWPQHHGIIHDLMRPDRAGAIRAT